MDDHHSTKIFFPRFILFHHFFSLLLISSSAYTPQEQYFIDCGSKSNTTVDNRIFIADDVNSGSLTLTAGENSGVEESNPPAGLSRIYQTARIFRKQSWYELDIVQSGTYVVRLHFYPLTNSQVNLNTSQFNVSTTEIGTKFILLSNFILRDIKKLPNVQDFLLPVNVGKFRITFTPSQDSSVAFINAIEAFLAPDTLVRDTVEPQGSVNLSSNLSSNLLHVIHRINVGGPALTPDIDKLWRNWEPDDDYLFNSEAAKNFSKSGWTPKYQEPWATREDAPDQVYSTARSLDIDTNKSNSLINITWRFNVTKTARYRVRLHFCDIVSETDTTLPFMLYINGSVSKSIDINNKVGQTGVPVYYDYVVDSDGSGFMSISVGHVPDSANQKPFLNGVEIMELTGGSVFLDRSSSKKNLIIIIPSVVGGLIFIFICILVLIFALRWRKKKRVETDDRTLASVYEGVSYGGSTERTTNANTLEIKLGLKLPFADIQSATRNFDKNLMIGEGGFGKVYEGILPDGMKVAVKRSEPGHGQGLVEFETEINLLSRIKHRHLVSLIGYCNEGSEMILVYEFMEKGTLRDHLYKSDNEVAESKFSWQQRLEICIGAAKGLHYLHAGLDGPIIHRDIKSTNILLDKDYVAKVSDFGLSRLGLPGETHVSTAVKGSFGYLDPEYITCLLLTQKSDVYSFGVVLLEVLCARPVIDKSLRGEHVNLAEWGLSSIKKGQLENIVDPLLIGRINPNSLRKFGETISKCLEQYGVNRPNIVDVLWNLEYALSLQLDKIPGQPYEDSTTDVSLQLPLHVINRLPSRLDNNETEMSLSTENTDSNYIEASQVFSQLNMDEAR